MKDQLKDSRRLFLQTIPKIGMGIVVAPSIFVQSCMSSDKKKMGVALVGLGTYSTTQLATALLECENCYLSGIVTGTKEKEAEWIKKYNIPQANIYNYDNFDSIIDNIAIDIVYIVLPNSMHAEFVIRAANAKKHVICEKPMGISSIECKQMIEACQNNQVQLSIGYRLHFDPNHQYLMSLNEDIHNQIKIISSSFAFVLNDVTKWRLQRRLSGGGPLMDLGVYCIQAACYITNKKPFAVTSQSKNSLPEIYKDIEESIAFQLHFDEELTTSFIVGYNINVNKLEVYSQSNTVILDNAYNYTGQKISSTKVDMNLGAVNQQKLQMDDFANSILKQIPTKISGEMGLRDMQIIEAIYKAAETRQVVNVNYL